MTQNRSTAVMQRRAANAPDALDYFPTPPWATRALCEWLGRRGEPMDALRAWEPACGEMHMAGALGEYFGEVRATDVFVYGGNGICDFLIEGHAPWSPVEWVITNPPFLQAERFIYRARAIARRGTAMLVRSAFLEGIDRYRNLYAHGRPHYVLQFAERVVMLRGRLIRAGAPDPFNLDEAGQPRKASSATSYCWLVWLPGDAPHTITDWIGPCRAQLEREADYPQYLDQWHEAGRREMARQLGLEGGGPR